MRVLLLILLMLPLCTIAQKSYKVYHYHTHTASKKGATMLKKYAKEFLEKNRNMLVRITDNPEVPEQYGTGKIYEDEHGV